MRYFVLFLLDSNSEKWTFMTSAAMMSRKEKTKQTTTTTTTTKQVGDK